MTTYKKWKKQLQKYISPLSKEEANAVLEYYDELYSDKKEEGLTEENILLSFGEPQVCALRILTDADKPFKAKHTPSVVNYVGLFFLTVLLVLPLAAGAFSIVVSFVASAFACLICSFAGLILVPLSFFVGMDGAWAIVMLIGMGICAFGVCLLLAIGFWFVAKYTYIGSIKALKYIYKRS